MYLKLDILDHKVYKELLVLKEFKEYKDLSEVKDLLVHKEI
jgi:hypothetical protein